MQCVTVGFEGQHMKKNDGKVSFEKEKYISLGWTEGNEVKSPEIVHFLVK